MNDLAAIRTRADSARRQAITAAVLEIDRRLGSDPLEQGESRDRGRRIFAVAPLALLLRVEHEGVARVLNVWEPRRR